MTNVKIVAVAEFESEGMKAKPGDRLLMDVKAAERLVKSKSCVFNSDFREEMIAKPTKKGASSGSNGTKSKSFSGDSDAR